MGGNTMTGTAKAETARQQSAVFAVDKDAALAELELAWAGGGYHGFKADGGAWSALSSAEEVLTGDTPDALAARIRAHWQARQEGRPASRACEGRSLGPLPRGDVVQDCVERRCRFEAEQPDVTIVTPARPGGRWRAILPLGVLPDDGTTLGARSLCDLMDKLDLLYQADAR
jgi:hypothetical protein